AFNKSIELMLDEEVPNDGEPYYYRALVFFEMSKIIEGCSDLNKAFEYGFEKENIIKVKKKYCN
ncbi:MAG: hypothetical protein ACR2KB_17530, partial [Chitinophagaceae bacterium]